MVVDRQVTSAALPGSRLPVSVSSKAHHALDSVYFRTASGTVIAHSGPTTPAARVIRVTELWMPNNGANGATGLSEPPPTGSAISAR